MAGKGANTAWRHDRVHVVVVFVGTPCVMLVFEVVAVLLVDRSMSTYRSSVRSISTRYDL